jgi:hypothetical protein
MYSPSATASRSKPSEPAATLQQRTSATQCKLTTATGKNSKVHAQIAISATFLSNPFIHVRFQQ